MDQSTRSQIRLTIEMTCDFHPVAFFVNSMEQKRIRAQTSNNCGTCTSGRRCVINVCQRLMDEMSDVCGTCRITQPLLVLMSKRK